MALRDCCGRLFLVGFDVGFGEEEGWVWRVVERGVGGWLRDCCCCCEGGLEEEE